MKNRMKHMAALLAAALVAAGALAQDKQAASDQQVRKRIVEESIAAYSGSCACPFSTMSNGAACGKRSAWSKKSGDAPVCYEREVTKEMVQAHLERERMGAAGDAGAN